MQRPWYRRLYPKHIRRAIVVAYATHFRALLEFFHKGRPRDAEKKRAGWHSKKDITFASFVDGSRPPYTDAEIRRLNDADKLAGHITEARVTLGPTDTGWGVASDLELLKPHILSLLATVDVSMLQSSRQQARRLFR